MTKTELINKVITLAESFKGAAEGSAKHKEIIAAWNKLSGIPGKASTSTPWCAIFVSVIFAKAGLGKLVPPEWNCAKLRDDFIKAGRWTEDENTCPEPGWVVIYNWDDKSDYAATDNKGSADHTGIVISVSDSKKTFNVIEGNYGSAHSCSVRRMNVNGRYLRGFGRPDYASMADSEPAPAPDPKGAPGYDSSGIAFAKCYKSAIAGSYRVTASDGLNLRNAPGTGKYMGLKTKVLKVIPYKNSCRCYGFYTNYDGGTWYLVKYAGVTGYVHSGYIRRT